MVIFFIACYLFWKTIMLTCMKLFRIHQEKKQKLLELEQERDPEANHKNKKSDMDDHSDDFYSELCP